MNNLGIIDGENGGLSGLGGIAGGIAIANSGAATVASRVASKVEADASSLVCVVFVLVLGKSDWVLV